MNLLRNASFDEGHYYQDNIPEIVVPKEWRLHWIDNRVFKGAESPAYRPESVVWNIINAPAHEKPMFFLSGNYCWKVFKVHSPLYFAMTQAVAGLTPGAKYRFNAKVFPDIVTGYSGGKKQRPGDIWAAEARAGWAAPNTPWPAGEDGEVEWSQWFNMSNKNFVYGAYNDVWVEFVAPAGGEVRVWAECKVKWGFENNWFMDSFSLEQVGDAGGPPPVVTPPTPPSSGLVSGVVRGAPRVQYSRTYILLPTSVAPEMAAVALRVAQENGCSVGYSPDDGGIGDLDMRRVICVSPEKIGTGISQEWYDRYYPDVLFVPIAFASSPADLERQLKALF